MNLSYVSHAQIIGGNGTFIFTRWAHTSCKWSYIPYKWPYKWETGVLTLIIISGVIALPVTGDGAHLVHTRNNSCVKQPNQNLRAPRKKPFPSSGCSGEIHTMELYTKQFQQRCMGGAVPCINQPISVSFFLD